MAYQPIIITGATQGLGYFAAQTLAQQGAGKPSSPESYDVDKARDLWETSEQLVKETSLTAISAR